VTSVIVNASYNGFFVATSLLIVMKATHICRTKHDLHFFRSVQTTLTATPDSVAEILRSELTAALRSHNDPRSAAVGAVGDRRRPSRLHRIHPPLRVCTSVHEGDDCTAVPLLDNMAQGSRDALEALLESDPIDDLAWTRHANPQAYRLVTQLRRYYRRELSHRGLTSPEAITVYYETVRLELL